MVQMLTWKSVEFYERSNGFPTKSLMRVCLIIETTQSIVSGLCQTTLLIIDNDINEPLITTQAKALFVLNISFTTIVETDRRKSAFVRFDLLLASRFGSSIGLGFSRFRACIIR